MTCTASALSIPARKRSPPQPYGGFCSTFSDNPNLSHLTRDLGDRFETLNVGCKPYPCCGSNHTSIDALKKILRAHPEVRADSVDKIRIRTTRATNLYVGWPYAPKSMTTTQMNLPFCVAVLLHDREFSSIRLPRNPSAVVLRADLDNEVAELVKCGGYVGSPCVSNNLKIVARLW